MNEEKDPQLSIAKHAILGFLNKRSFFQTEGSKLGTST